MKALETLRVRSGTAVSTLGTLLALTTSIGGCDSTVDDKPTIQFIPFGSAYEFFSPQRPWLAQDDLFVSSERYGLWRIGLDASNPAFEYVGHADTSRIDLLACPVGPCVGVSAYASLSDGEVLGKRDLDGGLWYRHPDSTNWLDISQSIEPRPYPTSFERVPNGGLLSYAPSFFSADAGKTWSDLNIGSFRDIGRNGSNANEIWLAGGNEHEGLLYRSTDGGTSWSKEFLPAEFDPVTTGILTVAVVDVDDEQSVFISVTGGGACRIWHRIGDADWTEAGFELPSSTCFIRSFQGLAHYLLLTTRTGQLAFSNDNGETWSVAQLAFETEEEMKEVAWDSTRNQFYVLSTLGVYVVQRWSD